MGSGDNRAHQDREDKKHPEDQRVDAHAAVAPDLCGNTHFGILTGSSGWAPTRFCPCDRLGAVAVSRDELVLPVMPWYPGADRRYLTQYWDGGRWLILLTESALRLENTWIALDDIAEVAYWSRTYMSFGTPTTPRGPEWSGRSASPTFTAP